MLRNNPSKAFWRGKSVQIIVKKPAETTLAGKIARVQHEIPFQEPFGGLLRFEREAEIRQSCKNHNRRGCIKPENSLLVRYSLFYEKNEFIMTISSGQVPFRRS